METAQTEVTGRLDSILGVLQEHLSDKEAENETQAVPPERQHVEIQLPASANHNPRANPVYNLEGVIAQMFRRKTLRDAPDLWNHNLRSKFDKDSNNKLEGEEIAAYKESLKALIEALRPLTNLTKIKELLESGVEVEGG